jgi:hypothetical protein
MPFGYNRHAMNPTQPIPGTTPPPYGATPPSGGGNDQWPIYVAIGCAVLGLCCFCGVGASGVVWAISQNGGLGGHTTVHVTATVDSYLGMGAGIGPGTTCDLPITVGETQPDGTQQCHVVMSCGAQPLYGDAQSGFFPCQFSTSPPRVVGQDTNTASVDHDGAFSIDTTQGSVSLADDFLGRAGMFMLTARITSVTAE